MKIAVRARRQQYLASFLMGLIFAVLAGTNAARADEPPAANTAPAPTLGFDISWPQCGGSFPNMSSGFAIIGVNGGRAYTRNRCFQEQYQWALRFQAEPAVYINLNTIDKHSLNTIVGPAGICPPSDAWCTAYNYGYNAARDAVAWGTAQGAIARTWWLDVETMNRWSADTNLNARVVGGAIDYLREHGLQTGIYSTPYQWKVITGSYAPGLPVWTAGAVHLVEAKTRCDNPRYAFGGGAVAMVQYVDTYDMNWICGKQ